MTVEDLACPKCGGPMPIEAAGQPTTCRFCNAAVVPKARELVVERVIERVVVARDPEAEAGPRCPRCTKTLREVRSAAKKVDVCERCGGVWVDRETADYLTRVSDPDLETAVRRSVGVVVSIGSGARQASVSCPVCEMPATRHDIPGTVNAFDRCSEHGTWFDRDELEMFIESHHAARTGEVNAADVPMQDGFFTRLFKSLAG